MLYSMYRVAGSFEEALDLADLRVRSHKVGRGDCDLGLYFGITLSDAVKLPGKYVVELVMDKDHGVIPTPRTTDGPYVPGSNMVLECRFMGRKMIKLEDCIVRAYIKLRDNTVVDIVEWR